MKDLLDKLALLRHPASEESIKNLTEYLGEYYSIPILEALVKHYKEVEKQILAVDLLEWMQENDLTQFENEQVKVTIATYVNAKIDDAEKAFSWLEKNEYGDLIKDSLDFAKGELTKDIEAMLDDAGASYSKKSGIHPQSLKKIMRDRFFAGEVLPDEDEGFKLSFFEECAVKEK